jgi:hypothetical protein
MRLAQLLQADILHHLHQADKASLQGRRQSLEFIVNRIEGFYGPSHKWYIAYLLFRFNRGNCRLGVVGMIRLDAAEERRHASAVAPLHAATTRNQTMPSDCDSRPRLEMPVFAR